MLIFKLSAKVVQDTTKEIEFHRNVIYSRTKDDVPKQCKSCQLKWSIINVNVASMVPIKVVMDIYIRRTKANKCKELFKSEIGQWEIGIGSCNEPAKKYAFFFTLFVLENQLRLRHVLLKTKKVSKHSLSLRTQFLKSELSCREH